MDLEFRPRFDFLFLRLLPKGCTQVRLVVVRVLPELPVEHVPLLLNPTLLPVLSDYVVDHWLADAFKLLVTVLIEPLRDLRWLGVFVQECNLFETVNDAFKVFLADHADLRFKLQVLSVFD